MPTGFYPRPDLETRFTQKFVPEPNSGCWLWIGALAANGYGVIRKNDRAEYAHRIAYEMFVREIPPMHDIDHLCRVRCCVNPAHLEAVTHRENLLRGNTVTATNAAKTHCIAGHALIGENLYIARNGSRSCQLCRRAAEKRKSTQPQNKGR